MRKNFGAKPYLFPQPVMIIGTYDENGKIVNVCADERILGSDGEISLEKFSPITYDPVHHGYYTFGEKVGNAFGDGAKLK